jgi:hypothetical protein
MKIFLIKIFLFCLPLIITAFTLDNLISKQLFKSQNKTYLVWNNLVKGKINSKILIYGSSRARAHVSSKILENTLKLSTYNLGIDGYCFDMQYCRHQLILKNNSKPKYIIQTLDYHTLGAIRNLYQYEQFCPYIHNRIIRKTISNYNGFNWFDYHIPLVRYYGRTRELILATNILFNKDHDISNRYNGFYNIIKDWDGEFEKMKKKRESLSQKMDNGVRLLFENYLKSVEKQNIKVIFVYTPEYIEGQKFISNRAEIINIYKYFSKKYNIPFLDYSSDPICLQRTYFYNAEHLNLLGSNLFSKKLASDLKFYIHQ